jgi:hypothetical protein
MKLISSLSNSQKENLENSEEVEEDKKQGS